MYVSAHVINYQHVSITSAIIIEVALQEYKEYNNLPYEILGTTQTNVSNSEYFHLHTFTAYCVLGTVVMLP